MMETIRNDNCAGLCCEKCCNKKYTRFEVIKHCGMNVILAYCDEHAEVVEEYELEEWKRTNLTEKR